MVADWLKILGIDEIPQWDVLVFLHRHRTTLLSAEHIARLMCYAAGPVITALDHLESKGIIERSRLSQGARTYQMNHLTGSPGHAFLKLMDLAKSRAGRLAVTEELSKMRQHATVSITAHVGKGKGKVDRKRRQSSGKGAQKWLKAI